MLSNIYPIPTNTKVLGAYVTPNFNTLISLFLLLFSLIFTASKAEVARSNRAGQAKLISVHAKVVWSIASDWLDHC
jgi:phosphatidylglycerophosphate synthase